MQPFKLRRSSIERLSFHNGYGMVSSNVIIGSNSGRTVDRFVTHPVSSCVRPAFHPQSSTRLRLVGYGRLRVYISPDRTFLQGITNDIFKLIKSMLVHRHRWSEYIDL